MVVVAEAVRRASPVVVAQAVGGAPKEVVIGAVIGACRRRVRTGRATPRSGWRRRRRGFRWRRRSWLGGWRWSRFRRLWRWGGLRVWRAATGCRRAAPWRMQDWSGQQVALAVTSEEQSRAMRHAGLSGALSPWVPAPEFPTHRSSERSRWWRSTRLCPYCVRLGPQPADRRDLSDPRAKADGPPQASDEDVQERSNHHRIELRARNPKELRRAAAMLIARLYGRGAVITS